MEYDDLGSDKEVFDTLPIPRVRLYGAASNARGRPLANMIEFSASQDTYIAEIELPQIRGCDGNVVVDYNELEDEVTIEGQITRGAIFADGPVIGNQRKRVQLCPAEPWSISFQYPEPVDWETVWISPISENSLLEIAVTKLSSSIAARATASAMVVDVADPSSDSSATSVDMNEMLPSGVSSAMDLDVDVAGQSGDSSPIRPEDWDLVDGWLV